MRKKACYRMITKKIRIKKRDVLIRGLCLALLFLCVIGITAGAETGSISPPSGFNTGSVTITKLSGTGFSGTPTVRLVHAGQTNITATNVVLAGSTEITCTFGLTGKTAGVWNVYVVNPDGREWTSPAATFTIRNPLPVPRFSANVTSGTIPLSVLFTDSSTGSPSGWTWFFGDETYTQSWTKINASSGWAARFGQNSVAMPDGSIILTGGWDGATDYNDTWRSTDSGRTWSLVNASSGWPVRSFHCNAALPDGSIVVAGGIKYGDDAVYDDTWRSVDAGATWTEMNASSGWASRGYTSCVALSDDSLVLMGGADGFTTTSTQYRDTWRSVDAGATWTEMNASSGWSARSGHSSAAMPDGSIILTGGYAGGSSYLRDTWRSVDFGATWTRMNTGTGWSSRSSHTTVAMPDNSIVLMGGFSQKSDVWRSKDNGTTWSKLTSSAGWWLEDHSSVALPNGSIVLMGGYNGEGMNETWMFNPVGSSLQNPIHTYSASGYYPVALQVYNANGVNSTRKVSYITATVNAPTGSPGVTSISVTSGYNPTNNSYTITGTNFAAGATVALNRTGYADIVGTGVTVSSPTKITSTFNLTGASAGLWNVTVTNTDGRTGSLVGGFTVKNYAPSVYYILPYSTGQNSTTVTTNLIGKTNSFYYGPPTVNLTKTGVNNITANPVIVNSATNISCTFDLTGRPAGSWTIVVTSQDGQYWSKANGFTITNITPPPTVSSVSPPSGQNSTTTPVTVTGAGFNTTSRPTVRLTRTGYSNITLTGVSTNSATSLTGTVPAGVIAGTWTVVVVNPDGQEGTNALVTFTIAEPGSGLPSASFTGSPPTGPSPLPVTFTDGSVVLGGTMWNWSFGDGTWNNATASSNPTHTYTTGTYSVNLTVTNATGSDTATRNRYITVTAPASGPTAAFSGTPASGSAPLSVTFTGTSTGTPTMWNWSFGDGEWTNTTTAAEKDPTHIYRSAGTYTVSLTATNAGGADTATKTGYITATAPVSGPTAAFSGSPVTGPYPLAVTFTDYSDNLDGIMWNWSFGDTAWTNTTSSSNPVHTYSSTGRYDVSLIVANATGNHTATKTGYITVTTTSGSSTGSGGAGDDRFTEPQRMEQRVPTQKWSSTTSVNVGGNTRVTGVTVTGTGIDDIIVTATGVSGPGRDSGPAPGIVYQYLEITPARYDTITGAIITFTVPQSWLNEHHLAPQDIVMHHRDGTSWQALPTTVLDEKDGLVYFSATCCSFSPFAITGKAGSAGSAENREMKASAQVKTFGELATSSDGASPEPAAPPVTRRPVVMQAPPVQQTTAVPAPVPNPGFPLATAALIGAGCVVLAGSGWYVRRWWIRRQNPALFMEYD